jgi:hypothetical protein
MQKKGGKGKWGMKYCELGYTLPVPAYNKKAFSIFEIGGRGVKVFGLWTL